MNKDIANTTGVNIVNYGIANFGCNQQNATFQTIIQSHAQPPQEEKATQEHPVNTEFASPSKEGKNRALQEPLVNQYPFVINTNKAKEIIGLLTDYMKGFDLSKPKDLMMPVRAAVDAGVIRKPTYSEFEKALPDFLPKQRSSFNFYLRPDIPNPYENIRAYKKIKEAFEALLA